VTRKLTREESRLRNHERLVDATIRLLTRVGVSGLTTREIANLADLSQPAFYLYFRSIDDVLAAAAEKISVHVRFMTLFVRHRTDRSTPLGRKLSKLATAMQAELVADLLAMGMAETIPNVELFAQLTTASVLATVEGLVDRRLKDVEATIDELTDAGIGTFLGLAAARVKKDVWIQWASTLLRLRDE
jgi:AcrR family transcriptional regulator